MLGSFFDNIGYHISTDIFYCKKAETYSVIFAGKAGFAVIHMGREQFQSMLCKVADIFGGLSAPAYHACKQGDHIFLIIMTSEICRAVSEQ